MLHLKDNPTITPRHREGVKMDTEQTRTLPDRRAAIVLYQNSCNRLLDVNAWNAQKGAKKNQYQLTGPSGERKEGRAKEGDYIKFNLPAPGNDIGQGEDWVRIEKIITKDNGLDMSLGMLVRPVDNPTVQATETSHFYSRQTTNTFVVELYNNTVLVGVYGRNELPNVKDAEGIYNKIRNAATGILAWLGISKTQWTTLAKWILEGNK